MSEAPATIWLQQVASDELAARRVLDRRDCRTYCQTVAKQQQTIEKSVKAAVAALREHGILTLATRRAHHVDHELAALSRLPSNSSRDTRDIAAHVANLVNERRRGEIRALCALAPRWPQPGGLFPRNCEYPYQLPDGTWNAPAGEAAFDLGGDVDRFAKLMEGVVLGVRRLVSALRRLNP